MDEIAAPGILAYKGGECFANLISIIDEIPAGRDISTTTLEEVLQQYLFPSPHFYGPRVIADTSTGTKF